MDSSDRGLGSGFCEHGSGPSGLMEDRVSSGAERLLVSHEGLCSKEVVFV